MPSKYAMASNVRVMKTCVMTLHVHHGERGSVISDCLVAKYYAFTKCRVFTLKPRQKH